MDLNLDIIHFLCKKFEINFKFSFSSELDVKSSKEQLILDICKIKKAKKYVSTIGANTYLKKESFDKNEIELFFFEYFDKRYTQLYGKFINNLSSIDLLFNEGSKGKKILKDNLCITKSND